MNFLRFFPALLLAPLMASAAAPADTVPPFIYYIAPISDGLNERLESLGLLPPHGGDADRKASVLRPLACAGGPCRRLVEPPITHDPKWYSTLLALEPTRAGRFVAMHISYREGYLSISIDMYDAKLGDSGKFEMTPRYFTIYNGDCSRDDSDDCLLQELGVAFERIASFWETRTDPQAWKVITAKLADREKLPFARDLVAQDDTACREQYGDYRVVKDFGDYLWLGFPPDFKHGSDSFVISARCR